MFRKPLRLLFALALLFPLLAGAVTVRAEVGEMGFFGGISDGTKLPKTTETILQKTGNTNNRNRNTRRTFFYTEVIFLSGVPREFNGILEISSPGPGTADEGTYTETHRVYASQYTNPAIAISREIEYTVNYRRVDRQVIKDYTVSRKSAVNMERKWSEVILVPEGAFTIDPVLSSCGISIIEDHTPAVMYYRGDISMHAVYVSDSTEETGAGVANQAGTGVFVSEIDNGVTVADYMGSFHGYQCAWSNTETHRMDVLVQNKAWQMQYQIRPSVSVNKTLQYTENEPLAISFEGNYKEVLQNVSGLRYDIFVKPRMYPDMETAGQAAINTQNTFEQLIAPDLNFLKGHPAEDDIKKLFSMQVLDGDPKFYQPAQAVTRGQFVTALVKAIKLPIEEQTAVAPRNRRNAQAQQPIVFPDVTPNRPEYPYIMAAYRHGLALGRDFGNFFTDYSMERQEAIVILLRTLGLQNLGLDPTPLTAFTDDAQIGDWAKREMSAAYRLGIIGPDEEGRIRPKELVTKAEAAAFVNHLIEYMRNGLAVDYADNIVNYPN